MLNASPEALTALQATRATVKTLMEAAGKDACKKQGTAAFTGDDKAQIEAFLAEMARYGAFFAPVGELEGWQAGLSVVRTNNKPQWLADIFFEVWCRPC